MSPVMEAGISYTCLLGTQEWTKQMCLQPLGLFNISYWLRYSKANLSGNPLPYFLIFSRNKIYADSKY